MVAPFLELNKCEAVRSADRLPGHRIGGELVRAVGSFINVVFAQVLTLEPKAFDLPILDLS